MNLLVVTPIHNEAGNIGILAEQMLRSSLKPKCWVIVDDGSSDNGSEIAAGYQSSLPITILNRSNNGGLIGGSAFKAWQHGVDYALTTNAQFTHVMKLDADVNLPENYLAQALEEFDREPQIGLVGGVLVGKRDREQTVHVPGPVKMYSIAAMAALEDVPRAVGFDVMDEVRLKYAGLSVVVRKDLPFTVRRAIGASQGLVHGRRRNGQVCKWTGYWPPYFLLHALRYTFRRPFGIGAAAMVGGYLQADSGPYEEHLRVAHRDEQKIKLKNAISSPRRWVKSTYGMDDNG